MSETVAVPKGVLHPDPCIDPGVHPLVDCASHDRDLAWTRVANGHGANADMVVAEMHTATEWVWQIDPEQAQRVEDARLQAWLDAEADWVAANRP